MQGYNILDSTGMSTSSAPPPFHLALPVHDLEAAKHFYGTILGCSEGRSSDKWQDYNFYGHQLVVHWVGKEYRAVDHVNPVDGDEVPVPHFGAALTVDEFHALAERLKGFQIQFIIEPHLRFKDSPGEQYTMFFKVRSYVGNIEKLVQRKERTLRLGVPLTISQDPSGNNLEFKAMTNPENLFRKFNE
eukprot:gb/GECG01016593.1/.p1 GENE.gb/GECG01016593.1/~~gb/GECG01016593.1/.p1  ORF type:complete len:188 (+),score=21.54 gb/GECG01016593.1/:1-564(+)